MTPKSHLRGQGCPRCARENQRTKTRDTLLKRSYENFRCKFATVEKFVEKASEIHKNLYDYSYVKEVKPAESVEVICPFHGVFSVTPYEHIMKGKRCPECTKADLSRYLRERRFLEKAKNVHGNQYDYSRIRYENSLTKIAINCPKHGLFFQLPHNHLSGNGCPSCSRQRSSYEEEIQGWLEEQNIETVRNFRPEGGRYEIDIFIPHYRVGIEFHDALWHCDRFKKNVYRHRNKMLEAANHGIDLFQIFDFEWMEKKKIIQSILLHRLNRNRHRVFARNCKFTKDFDRNFFVQHHIHGYRPGIWKGSLVHDGHIVASMICGKFRRPDVWEIVRYATSMTVVGGFARLFSKFVEDVKPQKVVSFADARYWKGSVYAHTGFQLAGLTQPNYIYVDETGVPVGNRMKFQKHKLKHVLKIYDPSLTEHDNCALNGLYRLFDAGHWKWVWKKGY